MRRLKRYKRQFELSNAVRVKSRPLLVVAKNQVKHKVAVIGAGAMGRDQCLALKTLPHVEIVAVADSSSQALERLRQQLDLTNTRFYQGARELLETESVDMLCVATNTTAHLEIAELGVDAGIGRLIVEKPIGNNVARARRFAISCVERGVKVAVNHSRRWVADYAAVKRCTAHGLIGNVREIHSSPGPGGLAMIGSHYFDLICYLTESRVEWLLAFLDQTVKPNKRGAQFNDPGGHCLMGLENGMRAYLDVSDDLAQWEGLTVLRGDEGRIEIDERAREWHLVSSPLGRRTFKFLESLRITDCFAKVAAQMLSDEAPSCGTEEGIHALEAVAAAHLSASAGNKLARLPIQDDDADLEMPLP